MQKYVEKSSLLLSSYRGRPQLAVYSFFTTPAWTRKTTFVGENKCTHINTKNDRQTDLLSDKTDRQTDMSHDYTHTWVGWILVLAIPPVRPWSLIIPRCIAPWLFISRPSRRGRCPGRVRVVTSLVIIARPLRGGWCSIRVTGWRCVCVTASGGWVVTRISVGGSSHILNSFMTSKFCFR